MNQTGHNSGHESDVPPGTTWSDLIAGLVETTGSLTAVAWRLVEHADGDDVASVERALRRLRGRGQRDGGVWGQRVLRVFGVPVAIEDRVRWMGLYHSPFADLPVALCLDQLRLWDRPPVSASRARIWVHLGYASCALRTRRHDDATVHITRANEALAALSPEYDCARIETALIEVYIASRAGAGVGTSAIASTLSRATEILAHPTISDPDRACFTARLVDHRAYQLNHSGDHAAALALYETLPAIDSHPFASYRRDAGLAFGYHRTGRSDEALALAARACDHAGDGGYTRLRAMGLIILATIHSELGQAAASTTSLARARAIAVRLGDDELLGRVDRRGIKSGSPRL